MNDRVAHWAHLKVRLTKSAKLPQADHQSTKGNVLEIATSKTTHGSLNQTLLN
jgi:hypothetical protein